MVFARVGLAVAASVFVAACGGESSPPAAATAAQSSGAEAPAQSEALAKHMRANFRLAIQARDALVDGDLAGAKAKAGELAATDYHGLLPETWIAGATAMQNEARAITAAQNLEAATAHMAKLAQSCGTCHGQLDAAGTDEVEHAKFAAGGAEDVSDRMARHLRAADEMWFGLSMPSEASWQEGGRLLSEAPDAAPTVAGQPADAELGAQMKIIRELGGRALAAKSQDERAGVYGELLGRCATCHAP